MRTRTHPNQRTKIGYRNTGKAIEKIWKRLQKKIKDLKLDAKKWRIYKDGLPC
jgi:hypothetical protein